MKPLSGRAMLIAIAGTALLAAVVLAFVFLTPFGGADEEASPEPVGSITSVASTAGSLSPTALAYGTVSSAPAHTRIITMPHEGIVQSVDVRDGDTVREGQAIVTIANAPASAAAYQQAQSAFDFAKQDLARVERLFAEKLATNDQLATARRALSDAQSQVDQLSKTGADRAMDTLVAPFDGVITDLMATVGDRPQVGAAIATVSSRSDVIVQLGLEPADATRLAAGAPVRFALPGGTAGIAGKLISVGAAVDPATHLVKAVASIAPGDAGHVTLGMTLVANVELPARQGMVVPRSALLEDAEGPYVFTVVNGKAHRQAVQIAVETDEQALIDKGLAAGVRVITSGNAALDDGVAVQEAKP